MAKPLREPIYYKYAVELCKIKRDEKDLTQEQLASIADCNSFSISKWENGKEVITDRSLAKLMRALGLSQEQVDTYVEQKKFRTRTQAEQSATSVTDPETGRSDANASQLRPSQETQGDSTVEPSNPEESDKRVRIYNGGNLDSSEEPEGRLRLPRPLIILLGIICIAVVLTVIFIRQTPKIDANIMSPGDNSSVSRQIAVSGVFSGVPKDQDIWIWVHSPEENLNYPQKAVRSEGKATDSGTWIVSHVLVGSEKPSDHYKAFTIGVMTADQKASEAMSHISESGGPLPVEGIQRHQQIIVHRD